MNYESYLINIAIHRILISIAILDVVYCSVKLSVSWIYNKHKDNKKSKED